LQGKQPGKWRESIWHTYWATNHYHWGVRTHGHKLIRFAEPADYEFYDLKKDPFEMNNVVGQTGYKRAITETGQLLDKLIKQVEIKPEQMPRAKKK